MHVRLERSDGLFEALGDAGAGLSSQVTLGPFDWVQLTYGELRIAPEGDVIAGYSIGGTGLGMLTLTGWYLTDRWPAASVGSRDREHPFSDVIAY